MKSTVLFAHYAWPPKRSLLITWTTPKHWRALKGRSGNWLFGQDLEYGYLRIAGLEVSSW